LPTRYRKRLHNVIVVRTLVNWRWLIVSLLVCREILLVGWGKLEIVGVLRDIGIVLFVVGHVGDIAILGVGVDVGIH